MCDPCADSWRTQVIERRWPARNETTARPGKTDMSSRGSGHSAFGTKISRTGPMNNLGRTGHKSHQTAIQVTLRVIVCLLVAMLVATTVWLVITFSQSPFPAPELNTPSFCHVPAVRDGLRGSLKVVISSATQKLDVHGTLPIPYLHVAHCSSR